MADVIQIDQIRLERKHKGFCPHKHLTYDPQNQYIECLDCGLPVQPFDALMVLVDHFRAAEAHLQQRLSQLKELEEKAERGRLIAVQVVDRAWRRKMAVCCPHCGQGIVPEDGLGGNCVSKSVEMERRRFKTPRGL